MVGLYLKSFVLLAGLAACLFLAAGNGTWGAGWVFLGCYATFVLLALWMVDPELLLERATPSQGFDKRDALLASAGFVLLYPLPLVVAGLDVERYGWSPAQPAWLLWLGCGCFAVGYGFAFWAMLANQFFTTFVRIQPERGHRVIQSGPYAIVRHPGYAGMLLAHFGIPMILGSVWALVPIVVGTVFFVARLLREERTLTQGLPAYTDYKQSVPWRLVPRVW